MKINTNIVILTFIVVIVVVLMTENLTMAALVLSLLINLLVLYNKMDDLGDSLGQSAGAEPEPGADAEQEEAMADFHPYGADYDRYHFNHLTYTDSYPQPVPLNAYSTTENTLGFDAQHALMARRRTRDKQAMDGAISKTADYYRYHFANELRDAEAREWWGQAEW